MARLSEQLKYFVNKKITEDANWRGVQVILSGHDVPGEGEHKIMEYIRLSKAQPDYNPNVRHCLYGLDADLIMLGLLSHDPHFCLLREEVKFGPARKKNNTRYIPASLSAWTDLTRQPLAWNTPISSCSTFAYFVNISISNSALSHSLCRSRTISNISLTISSCFACSSATISYQICLICISTKTPWRSCSISTRKPYQKPVSVLHEVVEKGGWRLTSF